MKNRIIAAIIAIVLLFACFLPWIYRHKGQNDKYDVVVFGDSIVTEVYSHNCLGMQLEEMSGRKVLTASFGGTTMADPNSDGDAGDQYSFLSMSRLSEALRLRDFSFTYMSTFPNAVFNIVHFTYYCKKLLTVDWDNVSYIIIEHGTNDYSSGIQVDNPDNPYDVKTFGGALRHSIENIRKGAPNATIILLTPIYNRTAYPEDCYTYDFGGGLLEDYVEKELEIAKEMNVVVVDNFHDSGINAENFDLYAFDNLHINDEGSTVLAERLYECIQNLEGTIDK